MVKGVNKRVIEVNNTGNKFFEKIVFYVTPQYSDLTARQLQQATEYLSLSLREASALSKPTLRKRVRRRKRRLILAILMAVLVLGLVALCVIL